MNNSPGGNNHHFPSNMGHDAQNNDDPLLSSYLDMNFTDSNNSSTNNNHKFLIDGDIDMLMDDDSERKKNGIKSTNNPLHNSFLNNHSGEFEGMLNLPDIMSNSDNNHFNDFDTFLQNSHQNDNNSNILVASEKIDISMSAKSNSTITSKNVDLKPKRRYTKKKTMKSAEPGSNPSDVDFLFNSAQVPVAIQGSSFNAEIIPDLQQVHGNNNGSGHKNMKAFDSMLEILPDGLDLLKDMDKQNDQSGIGQEQDFKNTSDPIKINGNMQNGEIANFWTFNVEEFLSQPSSMGSTTISAPISHTSQTLANTGNSIGGFGKPNVLDLNKQATTRRGSVASNSSKSQTHSFKTQQVSTSSTNKNDNKLPQQCFNCKTFKTPLWRRDSEGNTLCNACGLFHKLHGTMRPLSLKSDVIRKRNTKKKDKDGANSNNAESLNSTAKSRKASVVSLSNNEFIGLNSTKKESNKNKNININNKPFSQPAFGRRESSSSSLSAMKNRSGVYSSAISQSLPSQNGIPMKSRRSSTSSSASSNNSNKINIPILPKKPQSMSMTPNNNNTNSKVLMSTSHPNYNNANNGALFMSGGSFMENSPRFTQGSVVSLSPFAEMNGIDTSYSVVSTPSEINTPTISSSLHKLTNSNNPGQHFYNNSFISQVPSTTISNGNVLSLNGKIIQQQPSIPIRTPTHTSSSKTNNASNSFKQYSMAGPHNNINNNKNLINSQSNSLNGNPAGSSSNVSLLSQQLKKTNVNGGSKVNPHDVSGMYNSFYGSSAGDGQRANDFEQVNESKGSVFNNQNAANSNNNASGDDLSWLKFGM